MQLDCKNRMTFAAWAGGIETVIIRGMLESLWRLMQQGKSADYYILLNVLNTL